MPMALPDCMLMGPSLIMAYRRSCRCTPAGVNVPSHSPEPRDHRILVVVVIHVERAQSRTGCFEGKSERYPRRITAILACRELGCGGDELGIAGGMCRTSTLGSWIAKTVSGERTSPTILLFL